MKELSKNPSAVRMREYYHRRGLALRAQREANGVCRNCGSRPPIEGLKYCDKCRGFQRKSFAKTKQKALDAIFDFYGRKCACCGESNPYFLTVDHVNNDGAKERRRRQGSSFFISVAKAIALGSSREDIQILCFNCNCGKHRNSGACPHMEIRKRYGYVKVD